MVLISGTTFSAIGVPKLLYNAIFMRRIAVHLFHCLHSDFKAFAFNSLSFSIEQTITMYFLNSF